MKDMIAFCGLNCSICPMFIATQNDDDHLRAQAADMLNTTYDMGVTPDEINCDGCLTKNGRLLNFCSTCKVRACGTEKNIDNCAHCKDQPCENLNEFHTFSSKAKTAFNLILKNMQAP